MTSYICNTCLITPAITSAVIDLTEDTFTLRYNSEMITSVYVKNADTIYVGTLGTFSVSHLRISGFVSWGDFSGYIYGDISGRPSDLVTPYVYYCRIEPHTDFQLTFNYNTITLTGRGVLTTVDFETYGTDLVITHLTSMSVAGMYQGDIFTGSTIFDQSESLVADRVTINGSDLDSSSYEISSHYTNIAELDMNMAVPKSMINFDIHDKEEDLINRLNVLPDISSNMYWVKSSNRSVDYYEILDSDYQHMFRIYKVRNP